MAATGYTPISLYYSTTASAVPTAGNLANGELALNIADMKLYAKNSSGTVTLLASNSGATGTVSSVSGTGTVSGITLSGTVTSSGSLTLGGALDLSAYNGAGAFTTLSASSSVTLSGGTANGVTYLNGSKVLTSGSALTFNGSNTLTFDGGSASYLIGPTGEMLIGEDGSGLYIGNGAGGVPAIPILLGSNSTTYQAFKAGGGEQMRLTSTGLGIGTVPISGYLLTVNGQGAFTGPTSDVDGNGGVRINYGNSSGTVERFLTLNANGTTNAAIGLNMVDSTAGSMTFSTRFGNVLGERFRMGSLGQFGIAGANYGLAGQVLTSGGASAAPTWAAAGGGSQAFVAFGSTGGL